ncbi:MAG: PaaX family transcriptional regulator C-terminal domain-containing protein [Pseudomonadota bacterium]
MSSSAAPIASLLSRFKRQRPLRAGSLIVTVFGDSIAPRGGAVTLRSLIDLVAPFGLTDRLVRTSVARLAGDDWLEGRRVGRLGEYRITATGRQRFADATRRIYGGPRHDWLGQWTLVLLAGIEGPRRQQLRESLQWEGFGEPVAGVLASPTTTPAEAASHLSVEGPGELPLILEARSPDPRADHRLVTDGWDLTVLAARYTRFMRQFEPVVAWVREPPSPADAFALRTLLIHEYRKIHLRDPLLPASLLPRDWPGSAAYDVCRIIYERVFLTAEDHLSRTAARLDGPLPAPEPAVYQRFSGLRRH